MHQHIFLLLESNEIELGHLQDEALYHQRQANRPEIRRRKCLILALKRMTKMHLGCQSMHKDKTRSRGISGQESLLKAGLSKYSLI